jgi:PAS domain S-box-containing protein
MNLSYVNDAYCQFYGKKREELIGHNFLQWLPPDYRDECKKDTESLLKERRQLVRENLTYRYDGKTRWIQWIVQSITNVNNIVVEIQAVGRDITDRKLAEEAVRKSQATFHALFEYSPISLWVEDFSEVKRYIDGQKALGITNFRDYFDHNPLELAACAQLVKIVDVNQKTLELYESPTKEQFFQNLNSAFTEESYAQFEEELLALIDGNPIYEIESTNQTFTGKKIRVTIQTSIPTMNRDTWGMVLVSVLDITARKQAEEALHASEEKYRTLFESSVVGVAVTDPEGHMHECNNAIATIFGYTREEYLLLFAPNLYVNPKDRELILSMLAKDGVVENFETLMRRKNGTVFWSLLYVKKSSFKDSVRFLVTLIDIDQIKQAMQVLKDSGDYLLKLYEDASNISEAKTNLITFASHELKTPLVPIIGWADFMQHWIAKGKKLDEIIGMEEITSIQNSAKRLTAIINNFLDLGRIESKRLELKVQKHQSADLMKNAIDSVIQLALSRNITITDNIQDLEMWVDGFRVEQIFINILSNAIKYSPEGKQVWVTSEVADDLFTIIFKDQGYGFTPEQLKDVWRPFASKKTQSKQDLLPATGIGLFITKGLVERHSGKIEISSPGPNLGTTVRITLHLHLLKNPEM